MGDFRLLRQLKKKFAGQRPHKSTEFSRIFNLIKKERFKRK